MKVISNIGKYILMLSVVFSRPEKMKIFRKRVFTEFEIIGINSIPIVALMSTFMGAVIALQTASNIDNPLLPDYTVGYITQSSTILEFSPTIISLILAGKVGSNVASEIGTMRVTEQIDALEIMGVNSLTFLVLPKIVAAVFFFPILGIFSFFEVSNVVYALTKTIVFGFLIVSIASFYGYYTRGGALDVGRSSTQAVVSGSIAILIANFILTKLMLL